MKKFLSAFLCAALAVLTVFGFSACGKKGEGVTVYMPDGATALSMAKQMVEPADFGREVTYKVVDGSAIQTFVTGENPAADICVLPLNLASKLLGSGEKYKMLGTVTHGNLYLLKKDGGQNITADNLSSLVGKTVGVIQLSAVPGLTFELILKDKGIEFSVLTGGSVSVDKVNLKAVTAAEVLPTNSDCDYFVVPEPAATTKVNATGGKLSFAGDLQTLYGGDNGYPQAVLVAKNQLIESDKKFIKAFIESMTENSEWLKSDNIDAYFNDIVGAINKNVPEGTVSSINASNLNSQVIDHCAIKFTPAQNCVEEVNAFLEKLIAVNPNAASTVNNNFFYNANA